MEQLKTIGRELAMGSQGGWGQSKEFLDLVKSIGEARSKSEEDRIVIQEIETLKRRINDPDVHRRKMKEFIIRLVYIEMLGHDASFGYIHAVKMTHDDSLILKRTGYLAVTLFLNENHDLIILIVNTIQKDLRSDNYLVVCAALTAVCKLINEETIPAVLPQVVELLGHPKEAVRKKAVMALHRFHQRSPSMMSHLISNFRKRLCDNDPGVMGATLCPLFDLISEGSSSYKDLVMSFVSILKQVTERRLPKTYDYHQMPAPFIQIKLLKILALLGSRDKQASGAMYNVLDDIFRKSEPSSNIGNAVLYECICCVSSIFQNDKLLKTAADVTSKFLKSDSHNLKYMGIDALGRLLKRNPDIAEEHQLAVIDCLEDPDDTLKRKTFGLLYKMTKPTNVEVIVDRMIDYMISINDNHYKTEIASRCVELAEQFAPSNHWFIQTMNKVFEHAADLLDVRVAHNFMRLIANGEDDEGAGSQLRSSAVVSYLRILTEPKLPSVFLQVICWVLGEYGMADGKFSASYIMGKLCDVAEARLNDEKVRAYALTAIMKICAFEIAAGRKVELLPECQSLVNELSASHSTDLQQIAYELQSLLCLDSRAVEAIMPYDASCEDIEVDRSLSFLDNFVSQALQKGAKPYIPESERPGTLNIPNYGALDRPHQDPAHSLRFEAYDLPTPPPPPLPAVDFVPIIEPAAIFSLEPAHTAPDSSSDHNLRLRLDGVQKKWGRPSYSSSSTLSSSSLSSSSSSSSSSSMASTTTSASYERKTSNGTAVAEISPEKQRLAASLFGSSSARRDAPARAPQKAARAPPPPPPQLPAVDLLDMGETAPERAPAVAVVDPFQQLEGLLGSGGSASNLLAAVPAEPSVQKKGPNPQDSLEKDALQRQMGLMPSMQNPHLFRDLLG
ncbi:adaptin family protein [Wolffia australiana]